VENDKLREIAERMTSYANRLALYSRIDIHTQSNLIAYMKLEANNIVNIVKENQHG